MTETRVYYAIIKSPDGVNWIYSPGEEFHELELESGVVRRTLDARQAAEPHLQWKVVKITVEETDV